MTSKQYRTIRQRLGTQSHVARLLGVDRTTVARREANRIKITNEAAIALHALRFRASKASEL